jgi:hypothetical protein
VQERERERERVVKGADEEQFAEKGFLEKGRRQEMKTDREGDRAVNHFDEKEEDKKVN